MQTTASRFRAIVLLVGAVVIAAPACGKGSKQADPAGEQAKGVAPKAPASATKRLPKLPLQADVGEGWKIDEDKVAPEGGAVLRSQTGEVSIAKDGVMGVKKTTLDDEKQLMSSLSAAPQEVHEEKLGDGWVLSYKIPGVLPWHATVYRTIGGASYRCVITTEEAAQQTDGINVCKSLRPS